MMELQSLERERTRQLRVVNEYVRKRNVTFALANRAKKYLTYQLDHLLMKKYELELLQLFPTVMLMELHAEARGPLLMQHGLFAKLYNGNKHFTKRICHEA